MELTHLLEMLIRLKTTVFRQVVVVIPWPLLTMPKSFQLNAIALLKRNTSKVTSPSCVK